MPWNHINIMSTSRHADLLKFKVIVWFCGEHCGCSDCFTNCCWSTVFFFFPHKSEPSQRFSNSLKKRNRCYPAGSICAAESCCSCLSGLKYQSLDLWTHSMWYNVDVDGGVYTKTVRNLSWVLSTMWIDTEHKTWANICSYASKKKKDKSICLYWKLWILT